MNNLRGMNKGAFKCWQILYRYACYNVHMLERRQMASNALRSLPRTTMPITMTVPIPGLCSDARLYTTMANVWTGLQGQRTFATKVKSFRFDKFGRKMQNGRQGATKEGDRKDKVDGKTRTRSSRDEARHSTARSRRIPVPMGPEGAHFDAALEYGKAKMARKLYMRNKSLLQGNNNESSRRKSAKKAQKLNKSRKSATQSSPLRSPKEQESHTKPEREDLKQLLADLLDKRPKPMKSINFEYVKTSPIFKLLSHSAEHRHGLRGQGFQKQLEIPTFVKHPLGGSSNKRLNITRRSTLFPTESQFEKRTKEALKQKLCLLLLQDSNKDPDDDLD